MEALQGQLTQMRSEIVKLESENEEKSAQIQELKVEKNNLTEIIQSLKSEMKEKMELEEQHLEIIKREGKRADVSQKMLNKATELLKRNSEILENSPFESTVKILLLDHIKDLVKRCDHEWNATKDLLTAEMDRLQLLLDDMQTENATLKKLGENKASEIQQLESERSCLYQTITLLNVCLEEKHDEQQMMDVQEAEAENEEQGGSYGFPKTFEDVVKSLTDELHAKTEEIKKLSTELAKYKHAWETTRESLSAKVDYLQDQIDEMQNKNAVLQNQGEKKAAEIRNLEVKISCLYKALEYQNFRLAQKIKFERQQVVNIEQIQEAAAEKVEEQGESHGQPEKSEDMVINLTAALFAKSEEVQKLTAELSKCECDWKTEKQSLSAEVNNLQVQLDEMQIKNAILQNQGEKGAAEEF